MVVAVVDNGCGCVSGEVGNDEEDADKFTVMDSW